MRHLAAFALLALPVAALATPARYTDQVRHPVGDFLGSQGFVDLDPTMAAGSSTGDINTASTFTFGQLESTKNQTGIFVGMPTQILGTVTFNTAAANGGLILDSPSFGDFSSSSIIRTVDQTGQVDYEVAGNWTPGSYFHGMGPDPANVTIAFTQTPATDGAISASFTFDAMKPGTHAAGVGEPGTLGLLLATMSALALGRRHRG
jgi:hypothetical protein